MGTSIVEVKHLRKNIDLMRQGIACLKKYNLCPRHLSPEQILSLDEVGVKMVLKRMVVVDLDMRNTLFLICSILLVSWSRMVPGNIEEHLAHWVDG